MKSLLLPYTSNCIHNYYGIIHARQTDTNPYCSVVFLKLAKHKNKVYVVFRYWKRSYIMHMAHCFNRKLYLKYTRSWNASLKRRCLTCQASIPQQV